MGWAHGQRCARRPVGNIRQREDSLQVRLFAGAEASLCTSARPSGGTDHRAGKKADKKLAAFRTQVNQQRSATSTVTLGYAIDEWMKASELEDSTRQTYVGWIERTLRPVLGDLSVSKVNARILET